jgi:Lon protease-like protein
MSGSIERLGADAQDAAVDPTCRDVLKVIIDHIGQANFPTPLLLDDASWVSYRLAEVLPLDMRFKQELLELQDAGERLQRLKAALVERGLIVKEP